MAFEYKEHYQYPYLICLNVTDSCNLACRYCFVQQKPHFMTLETAVAAVEWAIENHQKLKESGIKVRKKPCITFFGGEPTLMWDTIIVPLVERYQDRLHYTITTNGTLLNQERIEFMRKHEIFPLLSMDGVKEVQDYNRPTREGKSSYDLMINNIPLLLKAFPTMTLRATVNQDTCSSLFSTYVFAYKLGFKSIFFCPNIREVWSQDNIKTLTEQIEKIYAFVALHYEQYGKEPMKFRLMDAAIREVCDYHVGLKLGSFLPREASHAITRCGVGIMSASVAYDGSIFACQEQDSRDTGEFFYLGNLFTNKIEKERHSALLEEYTQRCSVVCKDDTLCNNCRRREVCRAMPCLSSAWDNYKKFNYNHPAKCAFDEAMYVGAWNLIEVLKDKGYEELDNKIKEGVKYYGRLRKLQQRPRLLQH